MALSAKSREMQPSSSATTVPAAEPHSLDYPRASLEVTEGLAGCREGNKVTPESI